MKPQQKFLIGTILTFLISIGLIIWSYLAETKGTMSIITPVAVIIVEGAVIRILAQVYKFGKPVEGKHAPVAQESTARTGVVDDKK